MIFKDLPGYLDELKKRDLLDTIDAEVDPILEITEIADRVSKKHGRALVFNNVKGSDYPLVINAMGTYERLNLGLGVDHLDEIAAEIEDYMNLSAYATIWGKLKSIPKLAPLPFIFPRTVKHAPCQEVIEEPNLDTLPIIKAWPQDGGRYITLPLVFTKDPITGQQNVGMYRLQVYDQKTTGMHWHLHKDGKEIYENYRRIGKRMPVAVALGCDPATIYAATAPLPKMVDEMIFAGYLKKRPIEMVKCVTSDIKVPAHAEFVLEGYVDLNELRREGPFGDHTGYYSLEDDYPVFHLEKITRKKNPIYPTTIVGKPPMEDCYLGKATERIFLPLMKIQVPEIVDIDFPLEGVFHNCVIVSINKAYPMQPNKLMYALWGLGQMMYTKMIVVVDASVDVHDYKAVVKEIARNATSGSSYTITEGPLDALDHASNRPFQGFRLGVDATTGLPLEAKRQGFDISNEEIMGAFKGAHTSTENFVKIDSLVRIENFVKDGKNRAKDYMRGKMNTEENLRFLVLVDDWIDTACLSTVSWKIFNNIDPQRDMIIEMRDNGVLFVGIDATKKGEEDGLMRPWPDDIVMTEEMKAQVDKRWATYGIRE